MTILKQNNKFENLIANKAIKFKPYPLSPKIDKNAKKILPKIRNMENNTLKYIGANSAYESVHLYKSSTNLIYLFVIDIDDEIKYKCKVL